MGAAKSKNAPQESNTMFGITEHGDPKLCKGIQAGMERIFKISGTIFSTGEMTVIAGIPARKC